MATPPSTHKQPVMVRVSHAFAAEIKRLAERDAESQATVMRRLLRAGMAAERRTGSSGADR
jgi:hypothetical protein